jgi:3-isopropylmalate dehydrogenase
LDQGDRTGDIMSEGMNYLGCCAMGDALIQEFKNSLPEMIVVLQ